MIYCFIPLVCNDVWEILFVSYAFIDYDVFLWTSNCILNRLNVTQQYRFQNKMFDVSLHVTVESNLISIFRKHRIPFYLFVKGLSDVIHEYFKQTWESKLSKLNLHKFKLRSHICSHVVIPYNYAIKCSYPWTKVFKIYFSLLETGPGPRDP